MILTIMKQTMRYYLDEKEFEVANIFAEFYSKMIIQYVNNRTQAITALKDLAYEYYCIGHYRKTVQYFQMVREHYGQKSLKDLDLIHLGESQEKLNHLNEAVLEYQTLIRYYPGSHLLKKAYKKTSQIFKLCNNKLKSQYFRNLSINPQPQERTITLRKHRNIKKVS